MGGSSIDNWPLLLAVMVVPWIAVYIFCSYRSCGSIYLFSSAFILMLCLFHLGVTLPIGVGFYQDSSWGIFSASRWKSSVWRELSGWYTLVAVGCLGMGFAMALPGGATRRPLGSEAGSHKATLESCYWLGVGLLLASLMLLAYTVAVIGNPLQYSRFDFFSGFGADLRGWGVFLMAFPAAWILLVIGAQNSLSRTIMLSGAGTALLLLLLAGYRGVAMNAALAGVILWVKCGRRFPVPLAAGAVAFALIAIAAVAELRQERRYADINEEKVASAVEGADIGYSLVQMGQIGGVLAHVLRLVPEKYSYRYGMTYVQAIESSIPNIGLNFGLRSREEIKQQATFSRSTIGSLTPDEWLSYELLGRERFLQGHGVGFSMIGEPYLNFGYPGVIFFFVLLGFLLGKLDRCNLLDHSKLLIFSALMFPPLLRLVRSQFGVFTKTLVFLLIIACLWHLGTKYLRPRR